MELKSLVFRKALPFDGVHITPLLFIYLHLQLMTFLNHLLKWLAFHQMQLHTLLSTYKATISMGQIF